MLKWDSLTCHITTRLPGMQYTLWDVWPTEIQAGEVFGDLRSSPPPRASGGRALESKVVAGYVCIRCGLAGFPKHVLCVFFWVREHGWRRFFFNQIPGDSPFFGTFGAHRTIRLPKSCVNDYSISFFSKTTLWKTGGAEPRSLELWDDFLFRRGGMASGFICFSPRRVSASQRLQDFVED